jgi:thiamine transport system ATP-binding protein
MRGGDGMLELRDVMMQQGAFSLRADVQLDGAKRLAVIGPSGAGKSTLLMALAGFLEPVSGQIIYGGADITNELPAKRPFSVLFQDNNLFPHMSVEQNVGLGLRPSLKLTEAERGLVNAALASVGLEEMGGRKPAELSGGQQSRAALARVLVQRKSMILLDEPFAALGPALKAEMLDLVAELCETTGAGLMMVSHDPSDAERICDQAVLVADGAVHAPVSTAELLANPPEALRIYLGK